MLNCALLNWSITLLMTSKVPSGDGATFDVAGGSVVKDNDTGRGSAGTEGAYGVSVLTHFLTHRGV
jgi:hypothetical protein